MRVRIPNNWQTRDYQNPLWNYLNRGGKRAAAVWHRRAGKDSVALNYTAVSMFERVGTYWHMLPIQNQARKVVWDGLNGDGQPFMEQVFPDEIVAARRSQEMQVTLKNGSIWQGVGSDNYDSLIGSNPVGVVFSEWSVAKPSAWNYIRPILAENGGWALFIYTPRGKNHGYDVFKAAQKNPDWFSEILTVEDTGAIPLSAIEDERKAGMPEGMIQQEFYCSFFSAILGSYYGILIDSAVEQGRITRVPYDPDIPVDTAWDIGRDETAIWFIQSLKSGETRLIDFYWKIDAEFKDCLDDIKDMPYTYGIHYAPHDMAHHEYSLGRTRKDYAMGHGVKFEVVQTYKGAIKDGIEAVSRLLPKCWINEEKCERGIEALREYRQTWNEVKNTFDDTPYHDWASHTADALRCYAMGKKKEVAKSSPLPPRRPSPGGWMR